MEEAHLGEDVMERIEAGNIAFLVDTRSTGNDGGPSIEVHSQTGDRDVQLLRFDCFRMRPQYHYDPDGTDQEFTMDPVVVEDSLGWSLAQLHHKLPQMVTQAGYPEVSVAIEAPAVSAGLARVGAFFKKAPNPQLQCRFHPHHHSANPALR